MTFEIYFYWMGTSWDNRRRFYWEDGHYMEIKRGGDGISIYKSMSNDDQIQILPFTANRLNLI